MKKNFFSAFLCLTAVVFAADLTSPKISLPLNEGDTEALANTVKLTNTQLMSWIDGPAGKALYLDNALTGKHHALLTIPLPDEIRECKPFTISMQVKTPAELHKSRQYEIIRVHKGKKPGVRLFLSWKAFRMEFSEDGDKVTVMAPQAGEFPQVEPNRWYSIGVTYDGKEFCLYRDGIPITRIEAAYRTSEKRKDMNIGATSGSGTCYHYEGAITAFKYFAEALTPEEMARLATMQ